jgi:hypothetical protein
MQLDRGWSSGSNIWQGLTQQALVYEQLNTKSARVPRWTDAWKFALDKIDAACLDAKFGRSRTSQGDKISSAFAVFCKRRELYLMFQQ